LYSNKIKVLSIAGPTASGKTALSVAIAKNFNGEIVSADSMQIYKEMDIATAKPSENEKSGIAHHMMDFLSPEENYSVARYVSDATSAVKSIYSKGKLPIIVGGTGLYIDSLLNGIEFAEGEVDYKLREKLQQQANENGIDSLLDTLKNIDPEAYSKLSVERNPKRIIRALEIYYTTGKTMTEQNTLSRRTESIFSPIKIALNFRDRAKLYDRINQRVDLMIDMGLINEAEVFFHRYNSETAVQAIGYKELKPYFNKEKSLEDCISILKQSTRRYAKRQITWFMRDHDIKWFYIDDFRDISELFDDVRTYLLDKGFDSYEKTCKH